MTLTQGSLGGDRGVHGCWRSQSQSVWDKGQVSAGEEDGGVMDGVG